MGISLMNEMTFVISDWQKKTTEKLSKKKIIHQLKKNFFCMVYFIIKEQIYYTNDRCLIMLEIH